MSCRRQGSRHSGKVTVAPSSRIPSRQSAVLSSRPLERGKGVSRTTVPRPEPITTINASLVPSRTSGVAPLYVHFDATGTTSTATSYPFHECNFKWNFGDTAAGNYSTTNLSRNIAYGGVAGHVFEAAGAFTVTLTIKDPGGATTTTTTTVTVSAANDQYYGTNTICVSTSGDFTGAPPGADTRTTSTWATVMGYMGTGKRVLLRAGETWNATTATTLNFQGPWELGSFGTGDKPVVNAPSTSTLNLFTYGNIADGRFVGIKFIGLRNNALSGNLFYPNNNSGDRLLISRCEVDGFALPIYLCIWSSVVSSEFCIFECHFHHSRDYNCYMMGAKMAILGSLFEIVYVAHVLRFPFFYKSVVSNCIGRYTLTAGHLCLKIHNSHYEVGTIDPGPSQWGVFSDNEFEHTAPGVWAVTIGMQSASTGEGGVGPAEWDDDTFDMVFERNLVHSTQRCVVVENSRRTTVRNNVMVDSPTSNDDFEGIRIMKINPWGIDVDYVWVYNNTIYCNRTDASNSAYGIYVSEGYHITLRNNYASFPNYTFKAMVRDDTSGAVQSNNTLTNTPGFVSGSDFHLAAGSVAIDAGITVTSVYDDKDLVARAATYEQGAYEYRP